MPVIAPSVQQHSATHGNPMLFVWMCLDVVDDVCVPKGAHRALCARCAKSRLFSTLGSHGFQVPEFCTLQHLLVHQGFSFQSDACHGSQGPEFCTLCCLELIMHASVGWWLSGVLPG